MNTKLNHVQDWVKLAVESKWQVATLAKKCGVSVSTLERYFKRQWAHGPKAWLVEQRQHRAIELMRGGHSVKEAAAVLGYKHPSHFSNDFKRHFGRWPTIEERDATGFTPVRMI